MTRPGRSSKSVESSIAPNLPIEACFADLTDLANDVVYRREWIEARRRWMVHMAWVPGIG